MQDNGQDAIIELKVSSSLLNNLERAAAQHGCGLEEFISSTLQRAASLAVVEKSSSPAAVSGALKLVLANTGPCLGAKLDSVVDMILAEQKRKRAESGGALIK